MPGTGGEEALRQQYVLGEEIGRGRFGAVRRCYSAATGQSLAAPDHLLAEIFLRLPAPDDLARTSASCVSIRRLVTDRSFIRLFRRLHAPPLLGFLSHHDFNPAIPPHPSACAARALALAADFSFSFLPSHCCWTVQDTRDGRVLLGGIPRVQKRPVFMELVVCDPLHRRYVLLPPVPDDLTASVQNLVPMVRQPRCKPFLVPLDKGEAAAAVEDTAFRVIWMARCKTNMSAFVFSSSNGQWRVAASMAWTDLVVDKAESDSMSRLPHIFLRHSYAYGCFYWDWLLIKIKKLLVLDTRRMEFFMAQLPPGEWSTCGLAIVEAGEGRLGMFGFHGATPSDLSYTIARDKGGNPNQWQMEKRISLDSGYKYDIKNATERYLVLRKTEISSSENPLAEYFSMDIKTLKFQRFCAQGTNYYGRHIYTNFPPSLLSSPTI